MEISRRSLLKTLRFITIMLTALSMGMSFCHLLELVPRVFYFDAQLWITVTTKGLYYLFGTVGAVIEVGSVLTGVTLAFLTHGRGKAFYLTLWGAIFVTLALIMWFIFIAPINVELAKWTPTSFPADWTRYRNQWEYTHGFNAILKIIGLSLLVLSVLVQMPKKISSQPSHV